MCGITGIVAGDARRYRETLDRMTARLRHRGPDGSGSHFFKGCALGHVRLSVVDGARGDQPLLSHDGMVGVTVDGEIYGHRVVRDRQGRAHPAVSRAEMIIDLYQRFGRDFLDHLPGMFALAIWDDRTGTLLCARDRFGEKPFYYALGPNGEFIFGSEIKSILASGLVDTDFNPDAITHYVQTQYVHPTQSIYKSIHALPPAHALIYHGGEVEVFRYWDLPPTREIVSIEGAVSEFSSLLERAIERQLVADVPVGAFLSGGLDSTTVVAIAGLLNPGITTFSFGFEGHVNELPYAREAADAYGTQHIELRDDSVVRLDDLLYEMQNIYDEPFADSSNIPTYLIAKLAREHVAVVLGGDGGDELLGGHEYRFLFGSQQDMGRELDRSRLARELFFLSYRISKRLRLPIPPISHNRAQGVRLIKKMTSFAEMHRAYNLYFSAKALRALGLKPWAPPDLASASTSIDGAFRADLVDYVPGNLMVKTERACMANALELRSPFLDVDFAEFCVSLPHELKVTSSTDKRILREAFEERWPMTIRTREKHGFGGPVKAWLKRPEVIALKREFLLDPAKKLYSFLDYEAAKTYVEQDTQKTWMLLVLSLWMETRARAPVGS